MSTGTNRIVLRNVPAFAELPEAELGRLAERTQLLCFPRKATVMRQGDESRAVFFLLGGFVKVVRGGSRAKRTGDDERRSADRQEISLAILGPGHMLGEVSALTDSTRSASVVTLSDCSLLQVDNDCFMDLAARNPALALWTMRYMARRLADTNRQVELLRASTEARLLGLLRQLREIGLPDDFYPSNSELGRMVGASREMVSRVMGRIRKSPRRAPSRCTTNDIGDRKAAANP